MRKVLIYSILLVGGLVLSQVLPAMLGSAHGPVEHVVKFLTMFCLSFIMIHVGYEFEIDKSRLRSYGWDYVVAATAAAFPWVFCAIYFVYVMSDSSLWGSMEHWRNMLLEARFASPTSAGILFSMLAAAGLAATWVFQKARILAIFDDLDTVLLMIPLQMWMVGVRWQLGIIVLFMAVLLWLAWQYLHAWRIPITWPWVLTYAALIAGVSEALYLGSYRLDPELPIHVEVLLPAFVLGCMMARPAGSNPHVDDAVEGHEEGPPEPSEQRVATLVSAVFMILVGLSMPAVLGATAGHGQSDVVAATGVAAHDEPLNWGMILVHVLFVTLISNIGKMFPLFCYRREATFRERLALCVGMFPRGEVGAGVLVISLSYGLSGPTITVAMLSLALNLLLTGVFIIVVKRLIATEIAAGQALRAAPTA